MSNVQSPTSGVPPSQIQSKAPSNAEAHRAEMDFGLRTLDFGLRVTDLRKSFSSPTGERVEVLRGASFSANAGEAIAIMGTSGAGKSTLLHLLGGLESADHGSIVAGNFTINCAKAAALARFRNAYIGFVFQFHHLLADLTAVENVSLPLRINRLSRRAAMSRAAEMLEQLGLDSRIANSLVGHISGGEQQRVAVCRALITRPSLVLADEPTGNLDAITGDEVARTIVSYAQKTASLVIIATHNRGLAQICDRTLTLSEGRLREA
ncbi:MAG TPA: ABC transporter ATP-binding protein [Pyrinomonadaceae bacterium]|nr:ABC transporter ATP-binding protein [Pyrinomonadaceae bacterium]